MQVTRVKIHPTDEDLVRAYVDIALNNCWVIHGLKVIRHSNGYLVAMLSMQRRDGTFYDVAFRLLRRLTGDRYHGFGFSTFNSQRAVGAYQAIWSRR